MLTLLLILQLNTDIKCDKIKFIMDDTVLQILKYDGEGKPTLTYCAGD